MKKIINNHVYDTSGKEPLGISSSCMDDRLHYCEESLYRTRSGRYFLLGQGGAGSRYAMMVESDRWTEGERIIPMTLEEAKSWAENHLSGEAYESIFGPVSEDEDRMQLNLSVSAATSDAIHKAASARGISMGQLLDEMAKGLA